MAKQIKYQEDIRSKIMTGADVLANTMKITLGPSGRNAVIQSKTGSPIVTNDGATIAKEIELAEPAENIGAQILKEIASKTHEAVGDGTTTAVVLAQFILREGFKNIASGANPTELKKGIQGATQLAVAAIKSMAQPVRSRETLARVASLSAQDDGVGEMIAQAIERVGSQGAITIDESSTMETTLTVLEGMQFAKGLLSPDMVTDKVLRLAELDEPYILITDRKITRSSEFLALLEQIAKTGRSLLIIAEALEGEALGLLVLNKKNGVLNVAAVHPPAYGDGRRARMDDLALFTGGTYISEERGERLEDATLETLGSAKYVKVDKHNTVIVGGGGNQADITARINSLKAQIDTSDYAFDKKQLEDRLARLSGGVAVISVGATTETELKAAKLRIEGALQSAKAALAEGIVPGGGVVYLNAVPAVRAFVETLSGDMRSGATIIMNALKEPLRQIAQNTGTEGNVVVANVLLGSIGYGFNAVKGDYSNMAEAGIMDPAKVIRLALQHAASASAVLLTTEAGVMDGPT